MSNLEPVYRLLRAHELEAHKYVANMMHATQSILYDPTYVDSLIRARTETNERFLNSLSAHIRLIKCGPVCRIEQRRLVARIREVLDLWDRAISEASTVPALPI